jgi:hypothetical protein
MRSPEFKLQYCEKKKKKGKSRQRERERERSRGSPTGKYISQYKCLAKIWS